MTSARKKRLSLVAACCFFAGAAPAQVTLQGNTNVKGNVQLGGQLAQYVKIYALFPPESGIDQTGHFALYVMKADAIDGVTDKAIWSSVETTTPSATPCSGPPGTDVCQLDAFGWYHIFGWSSVDSTLSYWFSSSNGWGTKAVNVLGFSQSSPINAATPYYVTTSGWITHTGSTGQDVVNSPQNACTSYVGPGVVSISAASGTATVTLGAGQVTTSNGYPTSPTASDLVWISGATPSTLNTTSAGAQILSVNQASNTFTYSTACTISCTSSTGNAITSVQSWIVPYETPMKTAMKTFIAAAIQHFGPNHSGVVVKPDQVSYLRFGKSVGGESFVYCSTGLSGTIPAFSATVWQNYITEMTNFEQSQSPAMQIFEPINVVGSNNTDYSDFEAADAIAHGNLFGSTFGFGSQGMSLLDVLNPLSCVSNWCNSFGTYFPRGSPLELQQIANSDPTDSTCGGGGTCTPTGDSGDLRGWLPFVVSKHATILELYSVDADLAFDPNYCVLNSTPTPHCDTGSYGALNGLTTAQQLKFFQPTVTPHDGSGVGLGNGCGGNPQTAARGDCSYMSTINAQHGYH